MWVAHPWAWPGSRSGLAGGTLARGERAGRGGAGPWRPRQEARPTLLGLGALHWAGGEAHAEGQRRRAGIWFPIHGGDGAPGSRRGRRARRRPESDGERRGWIDPGGGSPDPVRKWRERLGTTSLTPRRRRAPAGEREAVRETREGGAEGGAGASSPRRRWCVARRDRVAEKTPGRDPAKPRRSSTAAARRDGEGSVRAARRRSRAGSARRGPDQGMAGPRGGEVGTTTRVGSGLDESGSGHVRAAGEKCPAARRC